MSIPNGSPRDRGAADSWYQRFPEPHYYNGHRRVEKQDMTQEQIAEYHKGYDDNEALNLHKDWS